MAFSEVLNKYKSALNLTQSALADICGTSPAVISRYLNGKRIPEKGSDIIRDIAKGIADKSKDFPDLKLSAKDIEKELNDSLISDDKDSDFYSKLDALLDGKEVSNTELAKVLPYDSSYISRVRNKKRIPKDQEEFLSLLEVYLNNRPSAPKESTKSKETTKPQKSSKPKKDVKVEPAEALKSEPSEEIKADSTEEIKANSTKEITTDSTEEIKADSTEEIKADSSEENIVKPARRKPRQTRFEYFLEKVSTYIDGFIK